MNKVETLMKNNNDSNPKQNIIQNPNINIINYINKNMLVSSFNNFYQNSFEDEEIINNRIKNRYLNPYIDQKILDHIDNYLYQNYKNLLDINSKNYSIFEKITENDKFFVIKSFTEEDIHKSMKYGVWSSSKNGNKILDNNYKLCEKKNANVFLFFSCNKSGRFCGVCKMITPVDQNKIFELWTQDNTWPGLFKVEWIFIKDVPLRLFNNQFIVMNNNQIRPISHSRDTQEIPFNKAKIMMEQFAKYKNSNTIFERFEFYDLRQDNYVKNKRLREQKEKEEKEKMINEQNIESNKMDDNNINMNKNANA